MPPMATKTLEDRLIDRMYELEEQYRDILDARAANRRSLRDLVSQGMLSNEQVTAINEIYKERAPRGSGEAVAA